MPSFPATGSHAGQMSVRHGPHPSRAAHHEPLARRGPARTNQAASERHAGRRGLSAVKNFSHSPSLRPPPARPASGLAWSLLGASSSAANHHDRAVAVGDTALADRAEEHAHELTVAVTPDDDEISGLREGLEHRRRMPLDN
jgi:hypothetical protein